MKTQSGNGFFANHQDNIDGGDKRELCLYLHSLESKGLQESKGHTIGNTH